MSGGIFLCVITTGHHENSLTQVSYFFVKSLVTPSSLSDPAACLYSALLFHPLSPVNLFYSILLNFKLSSDQFMPWLMEFVEERRQPPH